MPFCELMSHPTTSLPEQFGFGFAYAWWPKCFPHYVYHNSHSVVSNQYDSDQTDTNWPQPIFKSDHKPSPYISSLHKLHTPHQPNTSSCFFYEVPPDGFMKFNYDVSFIKSNSKAGIGLVWRDNTGLCRGAKGIPCRVNSAEEGEALAAAEAVKWANELMITSAIFEGDAKKIVGFLNEKVEEAAMDWRAASIIKGMDLVTEEDKDFRFGWINRTTNKAADLTAKNARNFVTSVVWFESSIPSFLFDVLSTDGANQDVIQVVTLNSGD